MKKISTLILFILLFLISSSGYSQTINARFSTYFYTWQRLDSLAASGTETYTTHIRGYQNLLFDISGGKWSFNTFMQLDDDIMLVNKIGTGFGFRFYNMYVKGSNLFNVLDLKLGRQYISAGVGKGTTDGAYMKLKLGKNKEYQFIAYGGELTPLTYEITKYQNIKNNYNLGGQFLYYGVKDLMVGLSYNSKNRKADPYYALRSDSLYNTNSVLIETDSKADQSAGLDFNYSLFNKHNFYGKAYYDLNRKIFVRGEFNTSIQANKNFRVSAGFNYREPQISYNSIFWVFMHSQTKEIEGGIDYLYNDKLNFYTRLANVFYDGENSLKFQLGLTSSSYGLSFVKYSGYTGESDGFYGYLSNELIKSKLILTSGLNYSSYKLTKYTDDRNNAFCGSLGFTYRPEPRISIDAQGQFITNSISKFDTRFLVGFNYWMFNKF